MARALGADPPVLLMDEPFGAIDPIQRDRLQGEFLRLQRELRKTVVFVTHDVDEAVRLGDRIAVLREGGVLEQHGPPAEVLGRPASPFVADFVGADRGLKRLSVTAIAVADLDQPPVVAAGAPLADARRAMDADRAPWAVVLDGDRPQGWLERAAAEGDGRAGDRARPLGRTVPAGATLKDAFAELLLTEAGWVPVVDGDRFLGVLTPTTLHAALRRSVEGS